MKHEPKKDQTQEKQDIKGRIMDNPEVMETDQESIYDMHDDMKTVDAIPVEELNQKVKDEENHRHTKDSSSSEERYPE
ncbi:hypothetical protein CF394_10330 [Tetzosporium hominis]|uniref:DUF4025 domain-containing protein n=2 Tax=Caryophanaceae TaxID=186818 RepID=A0A264W3I6_9BACL|nr:MULTISPECIES: hypothetical protein [Planococcaceae]OZS77597.1 hypothetical protein CF394_10330 [Tetzosporium hominis]PJK16738.1 hypothetical protein CQS04_06185 [Chryseomicrobium excrementi]